MAAVAGYWWLNRPPGPYKADNSGLYPINVGGKYGFMDRSGKTVIAPQFDETYGFSDGLAAVRIGTKFGYVNAKGQVSITPQFNDVRDFRYGLATVKLCCGPWQQPNANDRYGIIDEDGKYVSAPTFTWVGWWYFGNFLPATTANGKLAFVDRSGKLAVSGDFDHLLSIGGFADGLAPAERGGKWGYIDSAGTWAIDPQFEECGTFSEGLAGVRVGGRIGYIDRSGRFVVNPQYDFAVEEFHEGYVRITSAGKWGFVDKQGHVAIEPRFLFAGNFSGGLAPVKTEDGWGFVDKKGAMTIPSQFDSAEAFLGGLARVTALGKEGYITMAGTFVLDPFPGTTVQQEKARIAAEARQAALQGRSRVAEGMLGEWAGSVGGHADARLAINTDAGAPAAVLLNEGWRETLLVQLLDDNSIMLTGTGAVRIDPLPSSQYSLDTMHITLGGDGRLSGDFRDASGNTGKVAFQKTGR